MRAFRPFFGVVFLLAGLAADSAAGPTFRSVRLPASFRQWTIRDADGSRTTLSQISAPVLVTGRVASGTDLVLRWNGAHSTVDSPQQVGHDLGRIPDFQVECFVHPRSGLCLVVGAGLPTSRAGLSEDDLALTRQIAHPLLGFPTKRMARGIDANIGVTFSVPVREQVRLALGSAVLYSGPYALEAGRPRFHPGYRIALCTGIERSRSPRGFADTVAPSASEARLSATYRRFSRDKVGGRSVYAEGDELELDGWVSAEIGRARWNGSLAAVLKGNDVRYAEETGFLRAIRSDPGFGLQSRTSLHVPLGRRIRGGAEGEWSHFTGAADRSRNGDSFGLGPFLGLPLGSLVSSRIGGLALFGTTRDSEDRALDLRGFAVTLGIGVHLD